MESLRRLHFIWITLCLLAAALALVATIGSAYHGQGKSTLSSFLWAVSAVSFAFCFYPSSWVGKLTTLWLGGAGMLAAGAVVHAPRAAPEAFAYVVGGYVVAAVLVWVLKPMFESLFKSSSEG